MPPRPPAIPTAQTTLFPEAAVHNTSCNSAREGGEGRAEGPRPKMLNISSGPDIAAPKRCISVRRVSPRTRFCRRTYGQVNVCAHYGHLYKTSDTPLLLENAAIQLKVHDHLAGLKEPHVHFWVFQCHVVHSQHLQHRPLYPRRQPCTLCRKIEHWRGGGGLSRSMSLYFYIYVSTTENVEYLKKSRYSRNKAGHFRS